MDPVVIAAMAKWPDVPDCRNWLSLDRRGQWRLQGSPVRHEGLAAFIGRNYGCDASGAWFMQNGPQRVWVELAVTPWVFRTRPDGRLMTHTGLDVRTVSGAWLVDGEQVCLMSELGLGLIDDRDLSETLDWFVTPDGKASDILDALTARESEGIFLQILGERLTLQHCQDTDLPAMGGFIRNRLTSEEVHLGPGGRGNYQREVDREKAITQESD